MIHKMQQRFTHWWRAAVTIILTILPRVRLTISLFVLMLIFAVVTQSLGHGYWPFLVHRNGWDLTTIEQGRIYFAWTGLFFATAPLSFYGVLLLLILSVGALEYRRGTQVAALGFLLVGPIASILTLMLLWPISNAGVTYVRVALYTPDMGASTACFVCLGMLLVQERGRWRNVLLFGILAVLAGFVFQNTPYNIDHLNGYLVGLATGAILLLRRHPKHSAPMRSP